MNPAPALSEERGAVFVEKLIVYLPLLLTFFLAWELAEVTAASIVVQRACAAAGRAAIVVLPDDPAYYDGEPVGSYDGRRREDIELAAGMILSSIPKLTSEFELDVSSPSGEAGPIEVSLTAPYECGISILCGTDGTLELSATTTHTYHGAKYAYTTVGGGGLGGSTAALTDSEGSYRSGKRGKGDVDLGHSTQAVTTPGSSKNGGGGGKGGGGNGQGGSNGKPPPDFKICKDLSDSQLASQVPKFPADADPNMGKKQSSDYGKKGTPSYEALKYRCLHGVDKARNVAVLTYKCDGQPPLTLAVESGAEQNPVKPGSGTPDNWDHSEENLLKKYEAAVAAEQARGKGKNCKITSFYTERDPCYNSGGPSCQDFFNKGGTGQTKTSGLNMTPQEIRDLRNKITFHFEYNNNYRRFDKEACDQPDVPKTAKVRELCKKLKDNDEACKAAGAKNLNQDCKTMQNFFNKEQQKESSAPARYQAALDKYNAKCPKPDYPPPKPPGPPQIDPAKVKECLETRNLAENMVDSSEKNRARDEIGSAMKQQCAEIKRDNMKEPEPPQFPTFP
jgi:hypothetical protein